MKFAPVPLVANAAFDISQAFRFSIQVNASGTVSGNLTIQVSNDVGSSPSNWANVQAPIALSAAGSTIYFFADMPARWVRFTYPGTGTIAAVIFTQSA